MEQESNSTAQVLTRSYPSGLPRPYETVVSMQSQEGSLDLNQRGQHNHYNEPVLEIEISVTGEQRTVAEVYGNVGYSDRRASHGYETVSIDTSGGKKEENHIKRLPLEQNAESPVFHESTLPAVQYMNVPPSPAVR